MAWKTTRERARKDLEQGKRPSTAAGELVHEEMAHVRRGKHGARSRAASQALKREPRTTASHDALSKQARGAATRRRQQGSVPSSAPPQAAAADRPRRRKTRSSSSSSPASKASSSRARKRGSRKR